MLIYDQVCACITKCALLYTSVHTFNPSINKCAHFIIFCIILEFKCAQLTCFFLFGTSNNEDSEENESVSASDTDASVALASDSDSSLSPPPQSKKKRKTNAGKAAKPAPNVSPPSEPQPPPKVPTQIRPDDAHWPWPLFPYEIKGPLWKIRAKWTRRKELFEHFGVVYPNYRYPNPFPDITYP